MAFAHQRRFDVDWPSYSVEAEVRKQTLALLTIERFASARRISDSIDRMTGTKLKGGRRFGGTRDSGRVRQRLIGLILREIQRFVWATE